ncbi:MAG: MBL fold metallo-hydrolase [Eubacteriales bacterium]
MYELIQVGKRTYYINCPAKIGIYKINDTEVCLIDSGNDKEAGKKILKILAANQWTLKMIINTHSHADHIGGNCLLQQRTHCEIYTVGIESAFTSFPILESSFLYGGYPCKELRNKFLCAQPSNVKILTKEVLPEGMETIEIKGHSLDMIGLKTEDSIWFLADALTSEATIEKYHVPFLYDVESYIETLHMIENLEGDLFIPSHAEPVEDISALVRINLEQVQQLVGLLLEICKNEIAFDDILQTVFGHYQLKMDFSQHVLVGSTISSYLAYMHEQKMLDVVFIDEKLCWKTNFFD